MGILRLIAKRPRKQQQKYPIATYVSCTTGSVVFTPTVTRFQLCESKTYYPSQNENNKKRLHCKDKDIAPLS